MPQREVIYPQWQQLTELPNARGSIEIPLDTLEFWVEANFTTLPEQILCSVRVPDAGDAVTAHPKAGTITHNGFTALLDGKVTKPGHFLDYLAALP